MYEKDGLPSIVSRQDWPETMEHFLPEKMLEWWHNIIKWSLCFCYLSALRKKLNRCKKDYFQYGERREQRKIHKEEAIKNGTWISSIWALEVEGEGEGTKAERSERAKAQGRGGGGGREQLTHSGARV